MLLEKSEDKHICSGEVQGCSHNHLSRYINTQEACSNEVM